MMSCGWRERKAFVGDKALRVSRDGSVSLEDRPPDAVEKYEAASRAAEAAKRESRALLRDALAAKAASLFEKHPKVEGFSWRQYTPYFNDGDPCRFGVHADYPDINGLTYDEYGYGKNADADLKAAAKDIAALVRSFDVDDLEAAFGDPSTVFVYRDGRVETEDYDAS